MTAKDAEDLRRTKEQADGEAQQPGSQQPQQSQQPVAGSTPPQQAEQQQKGEPPSPYTPNSPASSETDVGQQLQIVGMSATLPNVDQVTHWSADFLLGQAFAPFAVAPECAARHMPLSHSYCLPNNQPHVVMGVCCDLFLGAQVANWLDAVLYKTTFRPIELKQWVKVERDLRDAEDQVSGGDMQARGPAGLMGTLQAARGSRSLC